MKSDLGENRKKLFLPVSRTFLNLQDPQKKLNPDVISLQKTYSKTKFNYFWTKFGESRHFLWRKCTAFEEESDVQLKNKQFHHPGTKNQEKLPEKN